MRADAIRFHFATFVAERGSVFFADENRFADGFQRSTVLCQKLFHRQTVRISIHGFSGFSRSPSQYSSGKRIVVTERSASVMTQSLVSPTLVR
jgi:hypothetical protein